MQIPEDYGYVAAAAGFIGIVQFYFGARVMKHRKFFSSDEFLANSEVKTMQDEHKKAFGTAINKQGYPDMGTGRYSSAMPYEKWIEFCNAQRVHYNMIESSGPVLASLLGGGLFLPKICGSLGFFYGISRIIYCFGYSSKKGADGRLNGALLSIISTFGLYGIAIFQGLKSVNFGGLIKQ